jgi:PAS domain S-box-containing protein
VERRQQERRSRRARRRSDAIALEVPRALLVEPHEDTRLLYTCLLEEAGYSVHGVADGIAAIRFAQQRVPDLVIMELAVPAADGFEILRQLRKDPVTRGIPAIVATASAQLDVSARARASGAALVLAKPVALDALLAAAGELIESTPVDRRVVRQLKRSLLTLRELGMRCKPDTVAQQNVRALIDRLQVAVLALDEQGRYVAASRGVSHLTGYSHAELLGMSVFDSAPLIPGAEHWQDSLVEQLATSESTVRQRGGTVVNIHTTFATILPGLHAAAFAAAPAAQ